MDDDEVIIKARMARLQKQRAAQMNVDQRFSGYRAAEVAANKAKMEAARQEFSVEDHLRQLEEQEMRHASGAMAEEERSDDEQPSDLDPAVSMFRFPSEFQDGRVVCDAIDGTDAVLSDLLNSTIDEVRTTLQSKLLLAYSVKMQRPLPSEVCKYLWQGAVRGIDHVMATASARNLIECVAAKACEWTLSYDHIVEALLSLRFTPFLWEDEATASGETPVAIELASSPAKLMTPEEILYMRLQCMLEIVQACLTHGAFDGSLEDVQGVFVLLVQVAADSGAQTRCAIRLSDCIQRVQDMLLERIRAADQLASYQAIADQIIAGLQDTTDAVHFGLAAVNAASMLTHPELCAAICLAAIAVITGEADDSRREPNEHIVAVLLRILTRAAQQEFDQEALLTIVYSLVALTDRLLCLTPSAWKHEHVQQLEPLLKRLSVRVRRAGPSARKLRAEDLVTKFPERCRKF